VWALNDHVIALGGGAVLREESRAAIKSGGHKVIYMRCEPTVLAERIAADPTTAATRPNLTAAGGVDEVKHLLSIREPLYREVMTTELDVTNLNLDEALKYVARMI
jgi:shikimate kinase